VVAVIPVAVRGRNQYALSIPGDFDEILN
jgi:hypothetical protein